MPSGVVAVHDPGGLSERRDLDGPIGAYRDLAAAGRLGMRVHACIRVEQLDTAGTEGLRSGGPLGPDPLDRLRMGWLKTFADGSLGSRTAALLAPLERAPGEPPPPNDGYGVWLVPPAELVAQADRAAALGITTQIHGIGDAAVRAALDALAAHRRPNGPDAARGARAARPPRRHLPLRALGIAASMQPIHVRSDAEKARRLWGARAESSAYALRRPGPGRRGHRVRDRCARGAGRPVARPGLRRDAVVSRVAGRACRRFGPQNALGSVAGRPGLVRGRRDHGRRDGPGTPRRRASSRRAVIPAAAVDEPVEVGGALWHARPRLVLLDGEVAAAGRDA